MPFDLTIAQGAGCGRRFRFDAGEVTIGRHPGSDLLLLDPSVSRSHARIRADGPDPRLTLRSQIARRRRKEEGERQEHVSAFRIQMSNLRYW